jgi:dissimilatory sulfite reductase (desulfoviridin) alpha/beta subunit
MKKTKQKVQMINDFLDNLGAQQYEKMIEKNASKEEYYNSQSEGKEFNKNPKEKETNS